MPSAVSEPGVLTRLDIVVVPFPFTDKTASKRRPALVLSNAEAFDRVAGHSVMAMITSADNAALPLDLKIEDLAAAGLPAPSVVRMKLFTLDHRFVLRRAGHLADADAARFDLALTALLAPPARKR